MDTATRAARDEQRKYSDEHFAVRFETAKPEDWAYLVVLITTNGSQWNSFTFYTEKQFKAFKKAVREFKVVRQEA